MKCPALKDDDGGKGYTYTKGWKHDADLLSSIWTTFKRSVFSLFLLSFPRRMRKKPFFLSFFFFDARALLRRERTAQYVLTLLLRSASVPVV